MYAPEPELPFDPTVEAEDAYLESVAELVEQ